MTIHRVLASTFFATLLAVSTPAVYAGGMGGAGAAVAFECYTATGTGVSGTINLSDEFLNNRTVTLGGLRLVCTPVLSSGWPAEPRNANPPGACDPNSPTTPCGDHLKCYDVRAAGGSPQSLLLSDFFFAASPTTATRAQLLCVGAQVAAPQ